MVAGAERGVDGDMHAPSDNPPLTPLLRILTLIEVIVLAGAGGALFFLPDLAGTQWPWPLLPFNTRFLGAIYLASLAPVAVMLFVGRWAPARGVLPALFTFTALVLGVSLMSTSRFEFQRPSTWIWFALYIILAINSAYHLWRYRLLPPADPMPVPAAWRGYLLAVAVVFSVYGFGLLAAPTVFSAFWPWRIDDFHGQMYSAAFLTGAVGALTASRVAARIEFFTAALTQGVLSLFAILGLLIVDASVRKVDWSLPGTWLWVGAFAVMLIASLGMLWQSRRTNNAA